MKNFKSYTILFILAGLVLTFFAIEQSSPFLLLAAGFPYGAVLWEDGKGNMGGTLNRAYYVPLSAIEAFPALPSTPSDPEEFHTLTGDFTLKAETNVVELYATYKTGTLKVETEGEIDGKFFKLTPEFFHPGSEAEVINFASGCINTPGILFLPESTGKYLVVGSPGHPVYLSTNYDQAKVGEGRKGTIFSGEAYSELMLTRYEGVLPLSPAS